MVRVEGVLRWLRLYIRTSGHPIKRTIGATYDDYSYRRCQEMDVYLACFMVKKCQLDLAPYLKLQYDLHKINRKHVCPPFIVAV